MNWFPLAPGYWKKHDHQRLLFDNFAKELKIKHPSEWFEISSQTLTKHCSPILSIYGNSLKKALYCIYPGIYYSFLKNNNL